MRQYYQIQNEITKEVWIKLVGMFSTCKTIEMIEYFGIYSDTNSRIKAQQRIVSPPSHFKSITPDFITISMRPLLLKWDSFSLIYSYQLSNKILSNIENWQEMELNAFSIKDDDYPVFLYSPLTTTLILIGVGQLSWASDIGLKLEKSNIKLNELID